MSQNHYQILGVSATASPADIKQAYKRLAVALHPDKHGGNPLYEERFKAVAVAYGVLNDPARRAAYDFQLRQAARRAAEAGRQQQYRAQGQHVYGVPMPPPAPLRTRRPAGAAERHYRAIPKQRAFTRRDYVLTFGLLAGLLVFIWSVKVGMDHITAVSNYEDGLAAYGRGKWETAHAYFSEALRFKPAYERALYRRGAIEQFVNRNFRAASTDYAAALRASSDDTSGPKRARMLYRLAQCQARLNQSAAAERNLTHSLALDSTRSVAWLARGEVRLFDNNHYTDAVHDFSVGLRQQASSGQAMSIKYLTYRGLAYYKLRDLTQARHDYRQVLEANPRNGQVHFLLGRVAQQEGNAPAACEFFRRAVGLGYVFASEAKQQTCP